MADDVLCASNQSMDSLTFVGNMTSFIDNEDLHRMQTFLTATGRGRPVKLQVLPATNRLLLQLEHLRVICKSSWEDIEGLFSRVTEGDPLQGLSLKSEIEGVLKDCKRISQCDYSAFLDENFEENISKRYIGPHLLKLGIGRQHLLHPERLEELAKSAPVIVKVTNGTVVDLCSFWKMNANSNPNRRIVLQSLGVNLCALSDRVLSNKIKAISNTYASLNKSIKRAGGLEKMNLFLDKPAHFDLDEHMTEAAAHANVKSFPGPSSEQRLVSSAENKLASLRRQLEDKNEEIQASLQEKIVLRECLQRKNDDIERLEQELLHSRLQREAAQAELCAVRVRLQEAQRTLKATRAANFYKRLKRKERQLFLKEKVIEQHESNHCRGKINNLKRKVKLEQTKLSHARKTIEKQQVKCQEVQHLRERVAELEEQVAEQRIIRLKDPTTGYFIPAAKLLIMELIGQHEVSAERCGKVIEAICRHLLHAQVPVSDLPSSRSALRFADVGHVIAKMQVTSAIMEGEHFDLHSDGTSKSGKKFVDHQITLQDGQSLSCGFTVVGVETASTVADVAMNLLEELSAVFEDDPLERHNIFLELLQRLSALMTDRAATMKSFGRQFNSARKELLQCEDDLAFLHCNAHFLLGLVTAVSKTLMDQQAAPVGRENVAKFVTPRRKEHAALRCIRETCACLGPRGDERFGCREQWIACCMMVQTTSQITSFKANRFNNLFEASAVIHFHREGILDFLENYMTGLNWKQEGILEDLRCDVLDDHLVSLGLMYFRLTLPYWRLLGQEIRYLDFYPHIVMMKAFLQRWAAHPADAFQHDFEPLFGLDFGLHNNRVFQSLLLIPDVRKERVKAILQRLSAAFLVVVENQLCDFLPGGKYHAVGDEELRERLKSSKLTNLIGEGCFGDLDFSIFKRRNASSHHHTTMNILKRNKTLTHWFSSLHPEDQASMLARATAKAPMLRQKHRQEEAAAREQHRQALEHTRAQKEAAAEKRRRRVDSVMARLAPHHGPCRTSADLDRLLQAYTTNTRLLGALRAEVMFHKLVRGAKSPLLKATAKMPELQNNLREFLGGANIPIDADADADEDLEDAEDNVEEEEEDREMQQEQVEDVDWDQFSHEEPFTFADCNPGTSVFVAYEDDFYVGEVEKVNNDNLALVNFMSKCAVKPDTFRWPLRPDKAEIEARFVLASNLELTTTHGRIWVLQNYQPLWQRYQAFHRAFFQ